MIDFGAVEVKNFMAISHAEFDLRNRGLVLIEGENQDDPSAKSNGAGKSSLVDAISWVLYGVTARGVTGDAVINRKAKSDCEVGIEVTVDGALYLIRRGRKSKSMKNRVMVDRYDDDTGRWVDMTLGTDRLTQERIDAILGCNVRTFNEAVYMGQEAMPDLPAMTDKALKATLEQALHIDKLDEALDIAKERWQTAARDFDKSEALAKAATDDAAAAIADLGRNLVDQTALKAEITALEKERKDDLSARSFEVNNLRTVYDNANHNLSILAEPDKFVLDTSKFQDVLDNEKRLKDKRAEYLEQLTEARATRRRLSSELTTMESDGCTACGRKFDNAEQIKEHRAATQAAFDLASAQYQSADEVIAKIDAHLLGVTAAISDHTARQMDDHAAATAEYTIAKAKLTAAVDALRRARNSLEAEDERHARWINDKKHALAKLQMAEVGLKSDIRALTDSANFADAEAQDLKARMEVLEKVKHVLSRKGFRGEVLDQVTPYLNARTQYYLAWLTSDNIEATWSTLTMNSSGDYTESFHIDVKHREGAESFAGLSGGEKRKVRLATAMALQDLVGTRAVKPIRLFVADEIDDAIDDSGLELLMGLLEEKAKTVGTLLIISHNQIGDFCKESITMVKKDGTTTIK